MRKFAESMAFPLVTFLLMGIVATAAFMMLEPTGADISNGDIIRYFKIGGWFTGLVMFILSYFLFGLLKLVQLILKMKKVFVARLIVIFASVVPWLVFSWILTAEPRYTNIAKAIIDFVARPMLWGSLLATVFVLLIGTPALFMTKKK